MKNIIPATIATAIITPIAIPMPVPVLNFELDSGSSLLQNTVQGERCWKSKIHIWYYCSRKRTRIVQTPATASFTTLLEEDACLWCGASNSGPDVARVNLVDREHLSKLTYY
ncbi:Hypothetical_protein [Hexamita inflata]|uniref:Hypothetical_protein n=1 Tax=Hexamita inflata TaxID=28002 RepID=A0AA86P6G3_9EUKA|nr:Hypothetical protein HINF_LOCUS18910 [Hexamita inflata]